MPLATGADTGGEGRDEAATAAVVACRGSFGAAGAGDRATTGVDCGSLVPEAATYAEEVSFHIQSRVRNHADWKWGMWEEVPRTFANDSFLPAVAIATAVAIELCGGIGFEGDRASPQDG